MSQYKKNLILSYLFFLISFIILFYAKINNMSLAFFYAFMFMMLYFNVNIFFICLAYFLIFNLTSFSMFNFIYSVIIIIFLIIVKMIHKFSQKPMNKPLVCFYFLIAQAFLVHKTFSLTSIIGILFGLIGLICFINYFKSFFKKGSLVHFTIDQNICGAVFLIAISLGLSQIPFLENYALKFFGTLLIFIFTYIYETPISAIIGILLGVGYSLVFDVTYLYYFSFISIFCYAFKGYNVFISCISTIVAELILGLYFNIYGYYDFVNLVPLTLAIIPFLIFKNRLVDYFKHLFGANITTYGIKTLVNRNREQICYKMNELSQVFNEMNRLYASMINGMMEKDEISHILIDNTTKNLCANCNHRNICFSLDEKDKTIEDFKMLFKKGLDKGKINILDIPSTISYKCTKISQLVSLINNLVVNFKQYRQMIKSSDMSKLLVAEQLRGVSSLLDMLSIEIGTTILFNNKMEQKIKEELVYYDVLCEEVLCYEVNEDSNVSLVVNNGQTINSEVLENLIGKILKRSYMMTMEEKGYYGNIYEFKPSPKFGYMFGASGKGKEHISGDTFSFTKINKNRVMFAICDGMGTGENAKNISEISLNLIENFYKAGYDSQIILSSVNKLLSTGNEENYSALDIVVFDLSKGYANFIKLGAPDGIIKKVDGMERIKAGALPLGILEEIEPMVYERDIRHNDIVYLFSDGIVDAFGSIESLIEFIDCQTSINPQTLADEVLNKSLYYNNSLDDKTVICIRLFLNC